jgi:polyvinyl alcohol dehydrogenase (cytochrome)
LAAGVAATSAQAEPPARRGASPGWPLASYDLAATHHNAAERQLGRQEVANLAVDWVFDSARAGRSVRPIHATPVVDAAGNAYVGDFGGTFFAVDARGRLKWFSETLPPTPALAALFPNPRTIVVGAAALAGNRPYVVFGDANGRIYARHRATGSEVWTTPALDDNPLGGVVGNSLTIVEDMVLVGLSSLENYAFVLSQGGVALECCTHRGGVVALDLESGAIRWRYETVGTPERLPASQAPFLYGPSGADVWSQPSVDLETRTVYISTGQNLSPTATGRSTPTSDAIIALELDTGLPRWTRQFTEDDVWAVGVPNPHPATGRYLDMDLGDSPKIYRLPGGRKVVGASQKDGRYHVVDAHTGHVVRTTQVIEPRSDLGGFQTGGAFANGRVFLHGLSATDGFDPCDDTGRCPYEGFDGVVVALSSDGARELWRISIPVSPLLGGLAVANGVVYFQSTVEEANPPDDDPLWGLYAIDARTGDVLNRLTFPGRAIGSPVVTRGGVFVTSGNAALGQYGFSEEGALIRLEAARHAPPSKP